MYLFSVHILKYIVTIAFHKQLGLSKLSDFVKICISGILEPSGLSKSNCWLTNDSFWWGGRLDSECAQLRVFYPSSFEDVDYHFELGKRWV